MAALSQVVNLVVLFFFIILGAVVEVFVSILLGALVCVLPLVVFVMFSPTSRGSPIARTLRQRPVTLLAVIVCASGFMVMIGGSAALDLAAIIIGLVLFLVGLVVLLPRLRGMQLAQGQSQQQAQTSMFLQQPTPVIPPAVYGEPTATTPPYAGPPAPLFAPPPPRYHPEPATLTAEPTHLEDGAQLSQLRCRERQCLPLLPGVRQGPSTPDVRIVLDAHTHGFRSTYRETTRAWLPWNEWVSRLSPMGLLVPCAAGLCER